MAFSASFSYNGIDNITPMLKKIALEHKKIQQQIKRSSAQTAKTQMKLNKNVLKQSKMGFKNTAVAHAESQSAIIAQAKRTSRIIRNEGSKKIGEGFKKAGGIITSRFTAPIVAGLALASKIGGDYEQSLASLSSITGLTGDSLAKMRTQIISTSNETGIGSSEIAKGMELIGSKQPQLLKTPKILLDVAKASTIMAKASGQGFDEAGSNLSDVMNQFSIGGKDAIKVVNVLGASAKFGASAIPELTRAIVLAGASANSAKISLQETSSMVEVLAGKGLVGARAGTQLRNVILKLETASDKKLRPSLVGIDKALENASKTLTDASKATKFFGVENFNASQILIKNREEVTKMTKQITGTTVAIQQAEIMNKTFNMQLKMMWNNIKNELIPVFEEWRPLIISTLGFLKDTAIVISKFIKNNKVLVIGISALGIALSALGTGLVIFAMLKTAIVALGVATAVTGGIMATAILPVAITIGAILAAYTFGEFIAEIDYITDAMSNWAFVTAGIGLGDAKDKQDALEATDEFKLSDKNSKARMKANELAKSQNKAESGSFKGELTLKADDNTSIVGSTTKLNGKQPIKVNQAGI